MDPHIVMDPRLDIALPLIIIFWIGAILTEIPRVIARVKEILS